MKVKRMAKQAHEYQYQLIIMRHAKTEGMSPEGDFARQLTEKGRKQAKHMAQALAAYKLTPDAIVCSSAVRAQSTCERMLRVFGDKPSVEYKRALYDEGMSAIFDALGEQKKKVRTLLIISHEPTVSLASQWIANEQSDSDQLLLVSLGFSPASIAVFGSDMPFAQWDTHSATLIGMVKPKECE